MVPVHGVWRLAPATGVRVVTPRRGRHRELMLVQEFVEGKTLGQERLERRYSARDVLEMLDELLGVLEYLHGLSPPVIHRDLKPENVMRRAADGALVLLDFGAVRDHLRNQTLGGSTVAGTFGYMAPEQFAGMATPATDLYGLGALALSLLARQEPKTLLDPHGGLSWETKVNAPAEVKQLLRGLLAPSPTDRFGSATLARGQVQALLRGEMHTPTPTPTPTPTQVGGSTPRLADSPQFASPSQGVDELNELERESLRPPDELVRRDASPPAVKSSRSGLTAGATGGVIGLFIGVSMMATLGLTFAVQNYSPTPPPAAPVAPMPDEVDRPPTLYEPVPDNVQLPDNPVSGGSADCGVTIKVRESGRPRDTRLQVTDACPREYAQALNDVVGGWRFLPPIVAGRPLESVYEGVVKFRPDGVTLD